MLSVITCDDRIKMTTLYVVSKETRQAGKVQSFLKRSRWRHFYFWRHAEGSLCTRITHSAFFIRYTRMTVWQNGHHEGC